MTEVPVAARHRALLRNALWWLALALFYAAAFRPSMSALQAFPLSGISRLLLGLGFHVAYGVAGFFCFTGPSWLRHVLVFAALLANGVVMEMLVPSYMYSHLAGMFLFGLFAAGGVGLGQALERAVSWARSRPQA